MDVCLCVCVCAHVLTCVHVCVCVHACVCECVFHIAGSVSMFCARHPISIQDDFTDFIPLRANDDLPGIPKVPLHHLSTSLSSCPQKPKHRATLAHLNRQKKTSNEWALDRPALKVLARHNVAWCGTMRGTLQGPQCARKQSKGGFCPTSFTRPV